MTACAPHGVSGDCGTCALLADLARLRALGLPPVDGEGK